jgi:hypothetical protein
MKSLAVCILMLTVLTVLQPEVLAAQSARVEPKSEVVLNRDAMDDAMAAWQDTDRGLEKSILRENPASAARRILTAASKRRALDHARQVYYDTLVREAREQLGAFEAIAEHPSGIFPREQIRRTLDMQLEQLMSREVSLKQEMAERDPGMDPGRRRLIEEQIQIQLEQLAELRTNLHQRKQALASMEAPESTLATAGKELVEQTRGVIRMLESNSRQSREEALAWQEYYNALSQLVSNRQKARPQAQPKTGKKE